MGENREELAVGKQEATNILTATEYKMSIVACSTIYLSYGMRETVMLGMMFIKYYMVIS